MERNKILNSPAIRRMPAYLHKLLQMRMENKVHVSTTELAEYINIDLSVVRKDIMLIGISGQRRVGYDINELISSIKSYLGWNEPVSAVLIGAGSLGSALLGYDDFENYGFRIDSVFDSDPKKTGTEIRGKQILPIDSFESEIKKHGLPKVAVICVSSTAAQGVAELLVRSGIRYIWNFANVALKVPEHVIVQREVIAGGLAMLTVKIKAAERKENKENHLDTTERLFTDGGAEAESEG